MRIENTFRFKFAFNLCENYEDIFEELKDVEDHFKTLKSLGVKKISDGDEIADDYHRLEIDTEDPTIIKKLRDMGFAEPEEEGIE